MRDVSPLVSPERFRFVGAAALALKPQRTFRAAPLRSLSPVHKHGAAEVTETSALVVDPDSSARSLLTVALRREGFEVTVAASAEEALLKLGQMVLAPELVLSETALPGMDGLAFTELLQERPEGAPRCVILLSREVDAGLRARARAAGADEVLPKPAFVADIVALAQLKLSGQVVSSAELAIPQLLRALLSSGRSGRVRLRSAGGMIAFREGLIVDASFQGLTGRRALERLLALGDGALEVSFGPTPTGAEPVDLKELCAQLLPRLRRFTRVLATSVPLDSVLAMDVTAFSRAAASLPHDIDRLARLCDGQRTVRQVLLESPFSELVALEALTRLYALGAVVPVSEEGDTGESDLARVLERFAPPAVARWAASAASAASNDERLMPAASSAEVKEGLAPELLRQLEAFQIRVVRDAEPFRFASEEEPISEVTTPARGAYELPEEGASPGGVVVPAQLSLEAAVDALAVVQTRSRQVEAHRALAAAADEASRMVDPSPHRAPSPSVPAPLLIAFALMCLAGGVALVRPQLPAPRPLPAELELPWYQDAVRLYESGDSASARELLEKAVVAAPDEPQAWTYLALARFESGEAMAAETAALRALELDPAQQRARGLLEEIALANEDR